MLFPARRKPRKFSYSPQYLKEKKEEKDREKIIKFRRISRYNQKRGVPILLIILAIGISILIIYFTDIVK